MRLMLVLCAVVFASGAAVHETEVQDALPNCVSIISINSPKTRRTLTFDNFGIASNTHGSLLSKHPGQFRIKKGGFLGKKGTVSIESLKNPGYFLRHKNYNFRLERTTKNSMFAKDATFYLLKVQDDPALYAFELYSHPSWFVAHKRTLPYKLTLRHVTGADQHVMDSTFFLEPRKCQTSGKGKDAQTKKATITDNAKSMGPQGSSGTIVVQNDPTSSGKDQDIITEVEKAFNSSMSGKSDKVLKALESDIERKVDGLADQVITPKDSASAKNDSAKDPQIDDGSENVVTQTVADFADSSEAVGTESADDVIVHVDSGNKKSMGSRKTGVESRVNKGEPKYQDKSNEASRSSEVHKGDPKQMDEHLEVISRNKLAKPSVKSAKRDLLTGQATPNKNSADKRTGFARAVELVNEAQSKLKNVLNKLDEKAASTKSGIKPARVATLVENIQKKMKQESAHARHLNISADTLHNLAKQTPAKVYFSESCEDAFPEACERWAKKRYCLTFNELMKRYCRKACSLCDHVITTGFTSCSKTCGGGVRLRMLKVNNRQVLQRRVCNVDKCPIDGGYTPFSNFSECSSTCGKGLMYRHRSCTNPPPQYGGRDCTRLGSPVDTKPCHVKCKDEPVEDDDDNDDSTAADTGSGGEEDETVSAHSDSSEKKEGDDFEHMPEYRMEDMNLAPGYNIQTAEEQRKLEEAAMTESPNKTFKWPGPGDRKTPMILHQQNGNEYEHKDHHGNRHILHIAKHHKHPHLRTVHYNKKPVAKLKCGPSMFLKYHRREDNSPEQDAAEAGYSQNSMLGGPQENFQQNYKRTPGNNKRGLNFQNYKVYEQGKFMYDKYGLPMDTTKEVIKAFDSPYKIVLTKNKKHEMVISEECLESDAGVNPDMDIKTNSIKELESYVGPNGLSGTIKIPFHKAKPLATSLTDNGMYEYKYENPGQMNGYTVEARQALPGNGMGAANLDNELKRALDIASNDERRALSRTTLMSDAKSTLSEELAAEREEALKEKKFEAKQRKHAMSSYRGYTG
ncbi:uncharacterized protein LOC116605639 isoform X2 [Nematostella vectensis]|uniref:uncharacterized protein LOC116605639 isoform X2 n=1 Tax=Nematostella vectensis TaxID=45351 RepID=UPI002077436F|nr:uncharacterized protein LOC116605639 isoform X2 [Nematostella vectensis]